MDDLVRFGPGHAGVSLVIEQARTLTEQQAAYLRTGWEFLEPQSTAAVLRYVRRHHADMEPKVQAWVEAAEAAVRAAVQQAGDGWGDKPLAVRASRYLSGMAALRLAEKATAAACGAALYAVTAHLPGVSDRYGDDLTYAWRLLVAEDGEDGRIDDERGRRRWVEKEAQDG